MHIKEADLTLLSENSDPLCKDYATEASSLGWKPGYFEEELILIMTETEATQRYLLCRIDKNGTHVYRNSLRTSTVFVFND